jgi:hypothetical protein
MKLRRGVMTKYPMAVVSIFLFMAAGVRANSAGPTVAHYHELIVYGEQSSERPEWVHSVDQEHGVFQEQPTRWVADGVLPDGQGRILINIDRQTLHTDIGISIVCEDSTNADIAVQLLDKEGRVVAADLVGNVTSVRDEAQTDTFAIPMRRHPTATTIAIQRITGHITIHGVVLFPLVIGDSTETALESQIQLLRLLEQELSPQSETYQTIMQIMAERAPAHQTVGTTSAGSHGIQTPQPPVRDVGASATNDAKRIAVGIDLHHGMLWKHGAQMIRTHHFQPVLLDAQITTNVLKELDILVIATDGVDLIPFSSAEIAAIADFVRNGGGLLCAAQAWSWSYKAYGNKPPEDYPLNALGRLFGFMITGTNIGTPFADASVVKNVVSHGWAPSRISFPSKHARPFVRDESLRAMAGSLEFGTGRIVVLGHASMPERNPQLLFTILDYLSASTTQGAGAANSISQNDE